jgi:hypothetical protein
MKRICWAHTLGGCGGPISREHVLSRGLYVDGFVNVSGFPWCRERPARIGLASFVRNSLCRQHNSRLSPVDQAGAAAFRGLNPAGGRTQSPSREIEVDGFLFERWVLKSVLNVLYDDEGSPGTDAVPALARTFLLKRTFGVEQMSYPMGLYIEDQVGQLIPASDDVAVVGHIGAADRLMGATVVIQGLRFLMWLRPEAAPTPEMFSPVKARLLFRPTDVSFGCPGLGDFLVSFRWRAEIHGTTP